MVASLVMAQAPFLPRICVSISRMCLRIALGYERVAEGERSGVPSPAGLRGSVGVPGRTEIDMVAFGEWWKSACWLRHPGRNRCAAIRASRRATKAGSLMARTAIVARPIRVRPTRRPPFQRKWRDHVCRRGLNRGGDLSCIGIEAGDVGSLGAVAEETGQGEVILGGRTAVLLGDDVVDLEGNNGVGMGELAVFAALACPLAYQGDERLVHRRSMAVGWLLDGAAGFGPQEVEFEANLAVVLEFLLLVGGEGAAWFFTVRSCIRSRSCWSKASSRKKRAASGDMACWSGRSRRFQMAAGVLAVGVRCIGFPSRQVLIGA